MTKAPRAQNYANHRKFVPGYHYVASILLLVNFVYRAYLTATAFSLDSVMGLLLAIALVLIGFYARYFPLGVQDRIIRAEERLRLRDLLPPEEWGSVDRLTTTQLIGLRFASDGEAAALVETVVREGIRDGEEIKKRVTNWRADHERI